MTQRVRVRIITVFSLITFLGGLGSTGFLLRRAATLQSLQMRIEILLQSVYRLTTSSAHLLDTAPNFDRAYDTWRDSIDRADADMGSVVGHPGMRLLGDEIQVPVQQADRLFFATIEGFNLADALLSTVKSRDLDGFSWTNLTAAAAQVRGLLSSPDIASVERSSYVMFLQAVGQISQSNNALRLFVGNELEGLGDVIESHVESTIRSTMIGGAVVVTFLLSLVLIALLTSIRFLAQANENLESNVRERTRAIQGLLDFSGQGFFSFGSDFLIRPEISRECDVIFGRSVVGEHVAAVLYPDEHERADFIDAIDLVFDGTSNAEVVFDLLDREIEVGSRTIELDFRRIDAESIMCSLRDVTERRNLESRISLQRARQEMVLRVVSSRAAFFSLLDEWERLITLLGRHLVDGEYNASDEENRTIVREVHTFKANAAFLQLSASGNSAHELESALVDYEVLGESRPVSEAVARLSTSFRDEREHILNALGSDWASRRDTLTVERDTIDAIVQHVRSNEPEDRYLLSRLEGIRMVPVSEMIANWSANAEQLAKSRGKRVRVAIERVEGRLSPEAYEAVTNAAIHLVRNMVDHGIEYPRERERAGKNPVGTITFSAFRVDDGELSIQIGDDGAGIRTSRIEEKARELGLINGGEKPSPSELVGMIFRPGFSTSEVVTTVSGRGVGASAALELIKSMNGRLSVTTKSKRGTTFTISVPRGETGS